MVRKVNWIMILFFSIFLGWFGIDRFLMGHVFLGILKLITFGGFGIWWLVDVILITVRYPFENIEWVDNPYFVEYVPSKTTQASQTTQTTQTAQEIPKPNASFSYVALPSYKVQEMSGTLKINWIFLLLMSFFFGTLGIDRFIMGHVGLGLLKLITGGGFGIWWIIDIILIAIRYPFENIEWT